MKVIRIAGPDDWEKEWKEIVSSGGQSHYSQIVILFFGTESPETGASWCSDCVIADPIIRKNILKYEQLNKGHSVLLLECPCNKSEYAGNLNYAYRRHKQILLERIPTLISVEVGQENNFKNRLVEEECQREELILQLLTRQHQ